MSNESLVEKLKSYADFAKADECHEESAVIMAAADEIERLRGLLEWQPIETAPKDGTWIMAHDPEMNEPCRRMFYCPSGWKDSDYDSICKNTPTHWMPLPGDQQ